MKNLSEYTDPVQETSVTSFASSVVVENELEKKDIYAKYRDTTNSRDNPEVFMRNSLTNTPKSKYDNVIGWVKLKK